MGKVLITSYIVTKGKEIEHKWHRTSHLIINVMRYARSVRYREIYTTVKMMSGLSWLDISQLCLIVLLGRRATIKITSQNQLRYGEGCHIVHSDNVLVNLSNLGSLVTSLMSKCSFGISSKPYVNYNTIERFISKLLAPKLVRSFFGLRCLPYRYSHKCRHFLISIIQY